MRAQLSVFSSLMVLAAGSFLVSDLAAGEVRSGVVRQPGAGVALELVHRQGGLWEQGGGEALVNVTIGELVIEPGLPAVRPPGDEMDGPGAVAALSVPGLGLERTADGLELPVLRRLLAAPEGVAVEASFEPLEIERLDLASLGLSAGAGAARASVAKCDCDRPESAGVVSGEVAGRFAVEIGEPVKARGRTLLPLTVSPLRLDESRRLVELARRFRIRLRLAPGSGSPGDGSEGATSAGNGASRAAALLSPHLDAAISSAVIDLDPGRLGTDKSSPWKAPGQTPIGYLIITPDWLEPALQPFVIWKTRCGYSVEVAPTSQTGSTADQIRSFIEERYQSPTPPVFVLLVGDSPHVLPTYVSSLAPGGTDLPFAQMSDDLFPDLLVGRWPVDSEQELRAVVEKTLHYEMAGPGDWWLSRALFVAGDEYATRGLETHQDVIAFLFASSPHQVEVELWNSETERLQTPDLLGDIAEGRAWVVYSAHSSRLGWKGPPRLYTEDVSRLDNVGLYPIGIGCSCESNMWASTPDAFSEAVVTADDSGFVAYWGASGITYWNEDDWLERGFFDSLFEADLPGTLQREDHSFALAAACNAGLLEVTLRGSREAEAYWHMYNLAGDPSLDPYTRQPLEMSVIAPGSIRVGVDDELEMRILSADGAGVASALIGITQNDRLLGSALTDRTGLARVRLERPGPGSALRAVVTAHNHAPATVWVQAEVEGIERLVHEPAPGQLGQSLARP